MVQQDSDSKTNELGGGKSETSVPSRDEETTAVSTKQTALRDSSQTSNAVTGHESDQKSPTKDIRPVTEISGTKRAAPESQESLPHHRSPSSSTNGQLVYVRRKSEADFSKSSASDNSSEQIGQPSQPKQPVPRVEEPKVQCFPAFAPLPMTSSVIPPGKPSVPLPVGVSAKRSTSVEPESRFVAGSSTSAARNLEVLRNLHWEARYNRLQTLLKKLDQRQQEGYVSLLRQLTPRELSGHAVELEKRSMQLSIEEAKELQRVEALNMLSKPSKSAASQASARPGRQGKS